MMLTLERSYLPHCTIGTLDVPGLGTYFTIERPWLGNKPYESCIPEGVYNCRDFTGRRFKEVWEICDVPERSYILIHEGNQAKHVQGCVAVGMRLSERNYSVVDSVKAINQLREFLPSNFDLRITVRAPQYP
ncbi:DUF5675 family protein [Endozoicomonas sp. ALC066]|uniref:DUF5675 family protein n=1 Tax=Endozoicomonas sp. ALC066 TaxID=3403078 RepID=UPI003BB6765B